MRAFVTNVSFMRSYYIINPLSIIRDQSELEFFRLFSSDECSFRIERYRPFIGRGRPASVPTINRSSTDFRTVEMQCDVGFCYFFCKNTSMSFKIVLFQTCKKIFFNKSSQKVFCTPHMERQWDGRRLFRILLYFWFLKTKPFYFDMHRRRN